MQFTKRALSAVVTAVVTASLAVAPALVESASAATGRAAVTQECADAQTAHALAASGKARAHRKLVKARKALRRAKHTHSRVKIRKAKRHLKVAKKRYVARSHNERVQAARVGYACAAPNSSARAAGTGMKLDILSIATGQGGKLLDTAGLKTLVDDVLANVSPSLSDAQLSALLSGFNSGTPSLEDATILLGSAFTPDQIQALLSGTADPTVVQALVANIVSALSGLTGGAVPVPSTLDATALQGIVDTVTTLLGSVSTTTTTTSTTTDPLLCLLGICI